MDLLLSIFAVVLGAAGIVGSFVPVLPGVILGYAGILCAFFREGSSLSLTAVLLWLAVAVIVTAADYLLPGYMTKRFGGSRAATVGATVGLIAGMLFTPVGMILGSFIGAVAGEMLNVRDFNRALKAGCGSFLSFIVGTGLKFMATTGMFIQICFDFAAWVASV